MTSDAVPPRQPTDPFRPVVRARAADLIATAYHVLGHRPHSSLVLVGLNPGSTGRRFRSGRVVRVDLPPPADETERVWAAAAVGALRRSDPWAVAVVAVLDGAGGRAPGLADHLAPALAGAGLPLEEAFAVDDDRYRSLLCHDPSCCPPAGHPLAEVLSGPAAVAHVVSGSVLAADQDELLADVEPVPSPPGSADSRPPASAPPRPVPGAELTAAELTAAWATWSRRVEHAAQGTDRAEGTPGAGVPGAAFGLDTREVRGLAAALHDVRLRDAVLLQALGAAAEVAAQLLNGDQAHMSDMDACLAVPPDRSRSAPANLVLAELARTAGPGDRAPALAVLAAVAWHAGDGVRARLLAERALGDRPGYSLAGLVQEMLTVGMPPPWVTAAEERAGASGARGRLAAGRGGRSRRNGRAERRR